MQISISDPILQTQLFTVILILGLALTTRKFSSPSIFSNSLTEELKGFAILTILFGHIGYFLSSDTKFLFPLSTISGVGVNLFLFLSGLGLTLSQLHRPSSAIIFYKKRALKLFLPLWIIISAFFILDYFLLNRSFSWQTVISAYLGWYPRADINLDINSPLWYFSFLLFYYVIFPWTFLLKRNFLPPLIVFIASYVYLELPLPVVQDILTLYLLHTLAFPLGMLLGTMIHLGYLQKVKEIKPCFWTRFTKLILLSSLGVVIAYTAIYSGVGEGLRKEQAISLLTTGSLILLFMIKSFKVGLLDLFGRYSYEIYLLHWPLMYRYDVLHKNLPPFLAVTVSLVIFIVGGMLIQKIAELLLDKIRSGKKIFNL